MSTVARHMRAAFIGGTLSYRALFNWTHPFMYATTTLGAPLLQMIFFTLLGRYAGLADAEFYVVGNAVLAVSGACLYGSTMAVANERLYRTLGPVLASPANRVITFASRGWPYIAHGVFSSAVLLIGGVVLFDFQMDPVRIPGLMLVCLLAAASCSAFGLVLGALGLRFRDIFILANVAHYVLLLVSGAEIPRDRLPQWLQAAGRFMPITAGIEAARMVVADAPWSRIWPLVGQSIVVTLAYGTLAVILLRIFEEEARRRGTLDYV